MKYKLSEIGEFGLIKRFKQQIKLDPSVIKGSGDDCAVLKFTKDKYLLFTCDTIIKGVDFTKDAAPYLIGRKAIAVATSDIAACAGIPHYCLVALGLPKNTRLDFINKFFKGMQDLARNYRINIVGGDLSQARQLSINVSMLGVVEKKKLVLRNGAKIGDAVFVSGTLGGSFAGKHLKFTPRIKEARFLVDNFKINAMIDISDGLVQDLSHILEQSRCGAMLYENLIPQDRQARSLDEAFFWGEDFELLFTLSPKEAKRLLAKSAHNFKMVGEIVDKKYGLRLIDKRNRERLLKVKGFRHF